MNKLSTFTQLTSRVADIGYSVHKVSIYSVHKVSIYSVHKVSIYSVHKVSIYSVRNVSLYSVQKVAIFSVHKAPTLVPFCCRILKKFVVSSHAGGVPGIPCQRGAPADARQRHPGDQHLFIQSNSKKCQ